jgi:hypothetical protein
MDKLHSFSLDGSEASDRSQLKALATSTEWNLYGRLNLQAFLGSKGVWHIIKGTEPPLPVAGPRTDPLKLYDPN